MLDKGLHQLISISRRTVERSFRWLLGYLAGFGQVLGDVDEFAVQALGCAPEQVESVTGGQPLAFHQNALGLPDDITRTQCPMQRGVPTVDLVAAVRDRHAHSQVRGR
jgi:hypothetical protein